MIILDTNVVSELMRGSAADDRVVAWVRAEAAHLVTTVITRAEVLSGIARLPTGRRRELLQNSADRAFSGISTVLPLTDECAPAFADVTAERRINGRPVEAMDALIAAIARVSGSSIATRNLDGFGHLGLDLINPWEA